MSRADLRKRLNAIDMRAPVPRRATADAEGGTRLRATVAAAFGINVRDLHRDGCPALAWLHRCREGGATAEDQELVDQIAAVRYFAPPVETRDYLLAISKIYREI